MRSRRIASTGMGIRLGLSRSRPARRARRLPPCRQAELHPEDLGLYASAAGATRRAYAEKRLRSSRA